MTLDLVPVARAHVPWGDLAEARERSVGLSQGWLRFLEQTQGVTPVIARVMDASLHVGWFMGALQRRAGIRQLGSPLPGWTTSAMGFTLTPGVDRLTAISALPALARTLGCWHLEVADRMLSPESPVPAGFSRSWLHGYELDLNRTEDDLLAAMTSRGRRYVRKALRNGVTVETVDPCSPGGFVDEFYSQLTESFAKSGQRPTYSRDRVSSLLANVGPTGDLLLLRARTPDGQPAATGIFTGTAGGTAEFWGGASHRATQRLLPNDALMWAAMRQWREQGAARFNFGGGGTYKAKYGGSPHSLARLRWSRVQALEYGREVGLRLRRAQQNVRYRGR